MNHLSKLTLLSALVLFLTTTLLAYEDARMMRYPDTNGEQTVFVYAGDIWTVAAKGGEARQLTSHKGLELFPRISPDGQWIAFSAEYSGNRQIYIMPSVGGTPRQLTFYNDVGEMPPRGGFDNIPMGWTPDSKNILFRSNRTEYGSRMGKYFTVNIEQCTEAELPIPYGGFATLSPDGTKVAFAFIDREFRSWKRYKGGRASDLWIYDLVSNTSEQITDFKGTDQIPVWFGNKIYFASDRDLWLNIYSYDTNTKTVEQITTHNTFDVMWPSGSNGKIAYEHGGHLYTLNSENNTSERIVVNIHSDNSRTMPYYKNVKDDIHSYALSPNGNRVIFDARGDIFSVPNGEGTIFNLTNTQGIRETYPQWSPDGTTIAYYSDQTGEYELYLLENKEGAKPLQITSNSKGWKYQSQWSPDSKKLLYYDRSNKLRMIDVKTKVLKVIDTPTSDEIREYTFSPDSKQIAYVKSDSNSQSSIWIYDIEKSEKRQLTNGMFSDWAPVFSVCGQYLFFLSNRTYNLSFSDFEFTYIYNNATRIYAMSLTNDSPRLLEPKETLEEIESPKTNDYKKGNTQKGEKEKNDKKDVTVKIDYDGANNRIVAFPLPTGTYRNLQAIENGIVYINNQGLQFYNIKEQKTETIMEDIHSAILSTSGKQFLYHSQGEYAVATLAPGQKKGTGKLNLDDLTMQIDPQKEWNQIFTDAWRIFRDYFYVSNIHNVDWDGFREKYSKMIPYINHRFDLDYIMSEMVSETNTGHAYVDYGDFERVIRMDNGLLGAKLTADIQNKRYKISKIYEGENWNSSRRSPLTEQGINVKEGYYLIAIDGNDITTDINPYRFLEGKAGKNVRITVNSSPKTDGASTYVIKPIRSESELMYIDWVNTRREMVDKLSGGKIGYIHVPNTAIEGNRELFHGMYAYNDKEALIIDDRYNGGGFIPDNMIALLLRKTMAQWNVAGYEPMKTPGVAHNGPKVMLINQYSSSGGDAFPYLFRQNKLGTLIGTRTWGGLVGISSNAELVDGGYIAVPRFGIYNAQGEWIIEGEGVSPDIEVIDTPHLLSQGKDPSIEKAVEVLLKELSQNPPKPVNAPQEPDRSKWIEKEIR